MQVTSIKLLPYLTISLSALKKSEHWLEKNVRSGFHGEGAPLVQVSAEDLQKQQAWMVCRCSQKGIAILWDIKKQIKKLLDLKPQNHLLFSLIGHLCRGTILLSLASDWLELEDIFYKIGSLIWLANWELIWDCHISQFLSTGASPKGWLSAELPQSMAAGF